MFFVRMLACVFARLWSDGFSWLVRTTPRSYSYAHFCRDLDELASALQMPHFCVAGHSSGGPYALAAAALLPERVLACAAVSSDPPYNHPRCPDVVRVSDSMASDQKGGFYGR